MVCTPCSLSQEVGLGLGAQAGELRLRQVVAAAGGFSRMRRATETPIQPRVPRRGPDRAASFYKGRIWNLRNFTGLPPPYSSATGPLANRSSWTSAVLTPLSITVMWLPLTVMS